MVVLQKEGCTHIFWVDGRLVWKRSKDYTGANYLDFDRHRDADTAQDYYQLLIRKHLERGWEICHESQDGQKQPHH